MNSTAQNGANPVADADKHARSEELLAQLDRSRIPRHVAVIMDGNGRWARKQGFADRSRGHAAAFDAVSATTRIAGEVGVKALTLYAFSTENWTRPRGEVTFLMRLFQRMLGEKRHELMENDIRLLHSGDPAPLPKYVQKALSQTIEETAGNAGLTVNLALNYGGRAEITRAARNFAKDVAAGRRRAEDLDQEAFSAYMYHPELGDPDLMIRTSGELRISNFLLWQLWYAEIHVTPTLWPDFGRAEFLEALIDFQKRDRRRGAIG
jgi:undecaprenyl diphosphate synthase